MLQRLFEVGLYLLQVLGKDGGREEKKEKGNYGMLHEEKNKIQV